MKAPSTWPLVVLLAASSCGCARDAATVGYAVLRDPGGTHHASPSAGTALTGHMTVNGVPNGMMHPGQSAEWKFDFADAQTGGALVRFDIHHEKAMHLIVVSRDLSSFAHLHPTLVSDGTFRLQVNASSKDPDNRDALEAVSRPGTYFLFSEVMPQGRSTTLTRFTVHTEGVEQPVSLTPDKRSPSGDIEVYASPDRRVGRPGDPYQVTLRVLRGEHHPGMPMMTFTINVRERDAEGRYRDVRSLEQWLGMPGHAVLIGNQGDKVENRIFQHLHASDGSSSHGRHVMQAAGPQLSFMAMANDVPPPGLYRLWCQFKHHGRVLTVPMTLTL